MLSLREGIAVTVMLDLYSDGAASWRPVPAGEFALKLVARYAGPVRRWPAFPVLLSSAHLPVLTPAATAPHGGTP